LVSNVLNSINEKEAGEKIKLLYTAVMKNADNSESLSNCIGKIHKRLSNKKSLSEEENQFLKQHKLYGSDVGLFSIFFFNILQLKPGQAIFTDAGVPHAYIKGNIIECMANSDNVVRAGLTNKFKDVDTLLEIVKYDFKEFELINEKQATDGIVYKTGAEEFEISAFCSNEKRTVDYNSNGRLSVYLIMDGEASFEWYGDNQNHTTTFSAGDAVFLPASLRSCRIDFLPGSKYFVVNVP